MLWTCHDIDYPDCGVSFLSSVPRGECRNGTYAKIASFQILSNQSFINPMLYSLGTYSIAK
jgi:hypothetical protein